MFSSNPHIIQHIWYMLVNVDSLQVKLLSTSAQDTSIFLSQTNLALKITSAVSIPNVVEKWNIYTETY